MRKVTIRDGKLVDLGLVKPRASIVHKSRSKVINMALIDACRRNDKKTVMELLRNGHMVTDWDNEALADMIGRAVKFKGKRGRPRTSNIHHAVAIAKHVVRPVLQKVLKKQRGELRKQKLPYGIEDAIIDSTVAYMDFEGMPVKAKTLRAEFHKSGKRRSK